MRSPTKQTAPNKLDHLVAGGQPFGLGLFENLLKECAEEASLARELAARAKPVGIVSYVTEHEGGVRNDVLFCYDLELPEDFIPVNRDGEIAGFELWPIAKVVEWLAEIEDFIIVRCELRKFPYLTDAIASDPHRAVVNRRAIHRHDDGCANDHFLL